MELFIKNIIKRGMNEESIDKLLQSSLNRFQAAFTSKDYNRKQNYEFFEQIGDLSINKFIVGYMANRFPQLRSSQGVGVLANLRILYGSKDTLSKMSEKYEMDKYVLCTQEEKVDKNKFRSILEDVFEAFFGALEFSIDEMWYNGLGYITVYTILKTMFDELDISIEYEDLVDAKTRLNELKDEYKFNIKYVDGRLENGNFVTTLYVNNKVAGKGVSNIKKTAQINAADGGLKWIEDNLDIKKVVPDRYRFVQGPTW